MAVSTRFAGTENRIFKRGNKKKIDFTFAKISKARNHDENRKIVCLLCISKFAPLKKVTRMSSDSACDYDLCILARKSLLKLNSVSNTNAKEPGM